MIHYFVFNGPNEGFKALNSWGRWNPLGIDFLDDGRVIIPAVFFG